MLKEFLTDKNNKLSMMRLAVLVSLICGSILIIAGIYGVLSNINNSTVLINSGAGLMGISGMSKAYQARVE